MATFISIEAVAFSADVEAVCGIYLNTMVGFPNEVKRILDGHCSSEHTEQ